jgi:hypothetical protein
VSLVGLGTVIVTFIVVGYMSATIVVKLGKKARNRSATVAACLSVVSAIAGTLILYRVVVHVVLYMWGGHAAGVTADFGWIVAAVGLVIALIASWSFAVKIVNETKFCEDCDCFMGIGMVGGLSLPDTVIVVEAIKQKKMSAAVGMVSATRLCLVIRKAGPARLHFKPKKRFSGLEESLAVPSRYYQTQPSTLPARRRNNALRATRRQYYTGVAFNADYSHPEVKYPSSSCVSDMEGR